ncbi:hypothetical protein L6452_35031 [Arctium lappa]|uniref:Uncharacterized protein n=1 Tax=Arctium lappa TaxID=4217 RepID=A0ACB8YKW8_ARCLA|nr:hypothetical protein L6452_35031 [Arctium lappa]
MAEEGRSSTIFIKINSQSQLGVYQIERIFGNGVSARLALVVSEQCLRDIGVGAYDSDGSCAGFRKWENVSRVL